MVRAGLPTPIKATASSTRTRMPAGAPRVRVASAWQRAELRAKGAGKKAREAGRSPPAAPLTRLDFLLCGLGRCL